MKILEPEDVRHAFDWVFKRFSENFPNLIYIFKRKLIIRYPLINVFVLNDGLYATSNSQQKL
ncbi:hypothetical protein BV455_00258 [Parageobacillus caldoxylosilyticus]|nr:hypothetical protein BV455_00258 [Parageobacillus caldoxylosilyticus]